MQLADFDFELPRECIAPRPVVPRDAARLLAVGAGLSDHRVEDLPSLLAPGDLLVLNDTKVMPTRLIGRRGSVAIEATLIAPLAPDRWRALVRPARRLKPGQRIDWAADFSAEVVAKEPRHHRARVRSRRRGADGGDRNLRGDASAALHQATARAR